MRLSECHWVELEFDPNGAAVALRRLEGIWRESSSAACDERWIYQFDALRLAD